MTLQANQITLTAPKPRAILSKTIRILRTDSSTVKCWLPKSAYIIGVHVIQTTNAVTAAGTVAGQGTQLDSDKAVISTYTVGSSTAGGEGFVVIDYFVPGPGEAIDD